MKKTFPFHALGKADARVLESIKHDLRKYVQRERRKTPLDGFTGWDFACKVGASPETATPVTVPELSPAVDAVAQAGAAGVYVEILSQPAKPKSADDGSAVRPA